MMNLDGQVKKVRYSWLFLSFFFCLLFAGSVNAARDYTKQPFTSTSPWNYPIGSSATYAAIPNWSSAYQLTFNASSWTTGIYNASSSDRQGTLYFNRNMWNYLYSGGGEYTFTNSGNSTAAENWLRNDSYTTTTPTDVNPYGGGIVGSYHHSTDYYYSSTFLIPAGAVPSPDTDGHIAIVQPNGWVLEAYAAIVLSNGDIICMIGSYTDARGAGTGWSSGRRASMLPNYAGLIKNGEVTAGSIPHALSAQLSTGFLTDQVAWPAWAYDTNPGHVGSVPMGSLLAIPASVNIHSLGLSTQGLVIAHALQDYGVYVTDGGGSGTNGMWLIAELGASDVAWSGWYYDLQIIKPYLQLVTNNSANTPGGGGTPRVALAPALDPIAGGDTTAPSTPTGLSATAASSTQINLSWTASTENVAVTGYKIFRGGKQVGTSNSTSYSDIGLTPSTQYTYTVSAYDAAGNNSEQSASTVSWTTPPSPSLTPAAPTKIMVR